MTRSRRWAVVALLVAMAIVVPIGIRSWPVADRDVSAAELLARVDAAQEAPWSGYAETLGTLSLPSISGFTDVAALFGGQTRLRAWWRDAGDWRVDDLLTAGETDLVHTGTGTSAQTVSWSYEDDQATVGTDASIRLPRTEDLLPPVLAERVLTGIGPTDVTRIGAERIAGRDALGLRVVPTAPQSSIDHVDVWADAASGVPLRVDVYAAGSSLPAFTTGFQQFSSATPGASLTGFAPPPGTPVRGARFSDIADAVNTYAQVRPPTSFGGLAESSAADGAVGVYGTGITQVIAIPLRGQDAVPLRTQLAATTGAAVVKRGIVAQVGPIGVLVTGTGQEDGWLVAGTVDRATLLAGAEDLETGTRYLGGIPEGGS